MANGSCSDSSCQRRVAREACSCARLSVVLTTDLGVVFLHQLLSGRQVLFFRTIFGLDGIAWMFGGSVCRFVGIAWMFGGSVFGLDGIAWMFGGSVFGLDGIAWGRSNRDVRFRFDRFV